jgi:hypothetical protein
LPTMWSRERMTIAGAFGLVNLPGGTGETRSYPGGGA